LKNRLDDLIKNWERENGVRLSILALSKATGVHRDVLNRYRSNSVTRYDESAVTAICRFFRVDVNGLLFIDWTDQAS